MFGRFRDPDGERTTKVAVVPPAHEDRVERVELSSVLTAEETDACVGAVRELAREQARRVFRGRLRTAVLLLGVVLGGSAAVATLVMRSGKARTTEAVSPKPGPAHTAPVLPVDETLLCLPDAPDAHPAEPRNKAPAHRRVDRPELFRDPDF